MLKDIRLTGWNLCHSRDLDFTDLKHLEHLDLGSVLLALIRLPQSLKAFRGRLVGSGPTAASPPLVYLPHLDTIECYAYHDLKRLLHESESADDPAPCPMRSLKIQEYDDGRPTPEFVQWRAQVLRSERFSDLRELSIPQARNVDEHWVPIMVEHMLNLESIDLESTDVTGYGIKLLVQSLPRLRTLRLNNCMSLSGDALQWARAQGIVVSYGTESKGGSGRIVRFG